MRGGATYRENRAYSPMIDDMQARVSMADERGSEFFMLLPVGDTRTYRERRDEALALIQQAIAAGLPPGEVYRL